MYKLNTVDSRYLELAGVDCIVYFYSRLPLSTYRYIHDEALIVFKPRSYEFTPLNQAGQLKWSSTC